MLIHNLSSCSGCHAIHMAGEWWQNWTVSVDNCFECTYMYNMSTPIDKNIDLIVLSSVSGKQEKYKNQY